MEYDNGLAEALLGVLHNSVDSQDNDADDSSVATWGSVNTDKLAEAMAHTFQQDDDLWDLHPDPFAWPGASLELAKSIGLTNTLHKQEKLDKAPPSNGLVDCCCGVFSVAGKPADHVSECFSAQSATVTAVSHATLSGVCEVSGAAHNKTKDLCQAVDAKETVTNHKSVRGNDERDPHK